MAVHRHRRIHARGVVIAHFPQSSWLSGVITIETVAKTDEPTTTGYPPGEYIPDGVHDCVEHRNYVASVFSAKPQLVRRVSRCLAEKPGRCRHSIRSSHRDTSTVPQSTFCENFFRFNDGLVADVRLHLGLLKRAIPTWTWEEPCEKAFPPCIFTRVPRVALAIYGVDLKIAPASLDQPRENPEFFVATPVI